MGEEQSAFRGSSPTGGEKTEASAELRSRLERIVTDKEGSAFGVPGAIFGVMTPSGAALIEALGVDGAGIEVTSKSFMSIASASKLATGLLILRLAQEGALDLDAEIGTYLPEAEAAKTPGMTLKRMLSHTGGLSAEFRHELSDPPGSFRMREALRWPSEIADACLSEAPRVPPGTAVAYSNVAFGLLGLVAERVTGQPFPEAMRSYVVHPLEIEAFVGECPPGHVMMVTDVPRLVRTLEPRWSRTIPKPLD